MNDFGMWNIPFYTTTPFNMWSNSFMYGSPFNSWGGCNIWGNSFATCNNADNLDIFSLCGFSRPMQTRQQAPESNIDSADVKRINEIKDSRKQIAEWLEINPAKENYAILDKKACTITIYDTDGEILAENLEAGIGKDSGDDYNDGYGFVNKKKPVRTTPAGEFSIASRNYNKDYRNYLKLGRDANKSLEEKAVLCFHAVPKSMEESRLHNFGDGNIENQKMSHGCVNFEEKSMEQLNAHLDVGSKIYILPEEEDNSLQLVLKDGEYKFVQTKYKHVNS